ncbi:TonB-dependent receptor family protein [Acinetobacter bouvetii]|uniref:Hemin receptor n=1 Tax=Acinetobacter bouvetii TaxID=202951 RepID=A0A811GCY7_9GAMM|nr:TonB-dependent receptor [Acinetobacter bouvetii]CAB1214271.1 Hemin receptor [Acinetobacter bouvetii]
MSKNKYFQLSQLSIAIALALPLTTIYAQENSNSNDVQVLSAVVVTGGKRDTAQTAKTKLNKIPGTTSVVAAAEVEKGRAANLEDVLSYQAGVFAAATGGNGANFVSIRGSGINTFYGGYARGIKYLYDGTSITGPGGTQETLLTPTAVNYTEVINGSNAFAYGATALGGAIQFTTHTGRSSPGTYIGLEGGSFDYRKYFLSHGGVSDDRKTDYYIAVSKNEREGFQEQTPVDGKDIVFNIGHNFSDDVKGRFIVRYREEEFYNGGYLTLAKIKEDPTQKGSTVYGRDHWSGLAVGKLDYFIDDHSKLELSLGYNKFDLDNGLSSSWYNDWPSTYITPTIRYLRDNDKLFGLPSDTSVVLTQTYLSGGTDGRNRVGNQKFQTYHADYTGSRDTAFAITNDLHLNDKTTLTTGLSAVEALRNIKIDQAEVPNTSGNPSHVSYDEWYLAPRLGLSYKLTPEVQFFTSLGRSIDAPVTWGIGPSVGANGAYLRDVRPQEGTTGELGVRINSEKLDGTLAVYRTWLEDEIHNIVVTPATTTAPAVTANFNASKTIHQGVEASLAAKLWESQKGSTVNLRQSYTFNDFFFKGDSDLGKNELPGLPRHSYQAELEWKNTQGYYVGVDLRAVSSYYVDYKNTFKAPSYEILGLRAGYEEPNQKWKVYVDLKNLTDEHYVATASSSYNYRGSDAAVFWPGDGRSVFIGTGFRF